MRYHPLAGLEHLARHLRVSRFIRLPQVAGANLKDKEKKASNQQDEYM